MRFVHISDPIQRNRMETRRNRRYARYHNGSFKKTVVSPSIIETEVVLLAKEVAALSGKTTNALEHLRRKGEGPKFRKEGKKVFYDRQSVLEYFELT